MTKSELKTGMVVTLRNGEEYLVLKDIQTNCACGDVIISLDAESWDDLASYKEDLTYEDDFESHWDIMKVSLLGHPKTIKDLKYMSENNHVLWQRNEKKRYTYAQLKEILGTEFEVIG
jgi:hypothetical protein